VVAAWYRSPEAGSPNSGREAYRA